MYYPGMSVRFWRAGIELGLTEAGINRFEIADRRRTRRHCGDGGGNGCRKHGELNISNSSPGA